MRTSTITRGVSWRLIVWGYGRVMVSIGILRAAKIKRGVNWRLIAWGYGRGYGIDWKACD